MFTWNHLLRKQMKEYIDLFVEMNKLFIRLMTMGEIILRLTRPHQFSFTLEENALSEYPQLITVKNRPL